VDEEEALEDDDVVFEEAVACRAASAIRCASINCSFASFVACAELVDGTVGAEFLAWS
jgi:hypothetical protein